MFDPSTRATRIVCTIGPSCASAAIVEELVRAGTNVARLNFSHGSHESQGQAIDTVRAVSARLGLPVAILQDLQGHKIRCGRIRLGEVLELSPGGLMRMGYGADVTPARIGIDYDGVARHVAPGARIYLDDGRIELRAIEIRGRELLCEVEVGGKLQSHKGVVFPDADLDFPLMSEKDVADARFGASRGVDMLAMSFVRSAAEILAMRRRLQDWGAPHTCLVAKIEDPRGVHNLGEILAVADGVLVARGDLGVTLPREEVPGIQRTIIERAHQSGIPVVTATQMLESMVFHDRPTRAEVSDVYHAVVAGTDAVMLSGETATGRYPVLAVCEMARICRRAERETPPTDSPRSPPADRDGPHARMATAAAHLAASMDASCILAFSHGGNALRALSAARCSVPVYGVVPDAPTQARLLLHRGLSVTTTSASAAAGDPLDGALALLLSQGLVRPGDRVVVVESGPGSPSERSYNLALKNVTGDRVTALTGCSSPA